LSKSSLLYKKYIHVRSKLKRLKK